jgi:hypothetical protein
MRLLNGGFPGFSGAYPADFIQRQDKYVAIPDLSGFNSCLQATCSAIRAKSVIETGKYTKYGYNLLKTWIIELMNKSIIFKNLLRNCKII